MVATLRQVSGRARRRPAPDARLTTLAACRQARRTTRPRPITAAWRAESARLVGALTRMTRDVDLAEDLAQDALVAALEQWPVDRRARTTRPRG